MTWPFENDTHKVEKKLATQSLSCLLYTSSIRKVVAGLLITAGIAIMAVPFFWRTTGEKQTEQLISCLLYTSPASAG